MIKYIIKYIIGLPIALVIALALVVLLLLCVLVGIAWDYKNYQKIHDLFTGFLCFTVKVPEIKTPDWWIVKDSLDLGFYLGGDFDPFRAGCEPLTAIEIAKKMPNPITQLTTGTRTKKQGYVQER